MEKYSHSLKVLLLLWEMQFLDMCNSDLNH